MRIRIPEIIIRIKCENICGGLESISEHLNKTPLFTLFILPKRYIFHFSLLKHIEIVVNVEANSSMSNKAFNDTELQECMCHKKGTKQLRN